MQLIVDGAFVNDAWVRWSGDPGAAAGAIIVAPEVLAQASSRDALVRGACALGLETDADARPEELERLLPLVRLVVVRFASTADGRGFSLARELRRRGFHGELRASGPLIADQYAFARASGFDTVEVPAALARRQPEPQWRAAARAIGVRYQTGYGDEPSVLERRHAPAPAPRAAPADPPAPRRAGAGLDSLGWVAWAAHW